MTVVLSTVEEALALFEQAKTGSISIDDKFIEELEIAGDLATLNINIQGRNYHGTIPAELARGLWEYQVELYRGAAYLLTGSADVRKLTAEQRSALELVFKVEEGSTDAEADVKGYWKVLKHALNGMSGLQKLLCMLGVTAILATGATIYGVASLRADVDIEKQHTAQMEQVRLAARDARVEPFLEANTKGVTSVIKSASDADHISINNSGFDRRAIEEITKKADKSPKTADVVTWPFRVFQIEAKDNSRTRCILAAPDGTEFPIVIDHETIDRESIEKIWTAARERQSINIEINLTYQNEQIKTAQILSVPVDDQTDGAPVSP